MAYYWTTEDLDAGRCKISDLGQARPLVEVIDAATTVLDDSPEAMARVGITTLMRLAQQSRDLPTSLKAAALLLDRALGKVGPPQLSPPPEPTDPQEGQLPPPPWLDQSKRLSYQALEPSQVHSQIDSPIGNTVLLHGTQDVIRD